MTNQHIKSLDHLVLPVYSLDQARDRLTQLGFNVAPDAKHPFGTENACVYFENDTYLEPLAVGHRETYEAHAVKGNAFLRRDWAYRFRNGNDGMWGLALTSSDAKADAKHYKKSGNDFGRLFSFKRKAKLPDGSTKTLGVRLAMAVTDWAPDLTLFSCERFSEKITAPQQMHHENGAIGVTNVLLGEINPSDFQYYLQDVTGDREIGSDSFGIEVQLPNTNITVLTPAGLRGFYGIKNAISGRGLKALGFDIIVSDLGKVSELLKSNKIESKMVGNRLVVPPAKGQGYTLAFVDAKPATKGSR